MIIAQALCAKNNHNVGACIKGLSSLGIFFELPISLFSVFRAQKYPSAYTNALTWEAVLKIYTETGGADDEKWFQLFFSKYISTVAVNQMITIGQTIEITAIYNNHYNEIRNASADLRPTLLRQITNRNIPTVTTQMAIKRLADDFEIEYTD